MGANAGCACGRFCIRIMRIIPATPLIKISQIGKDKTVIIFFLYDLEVISNLVRILHNYSGRVNKLTRFPIHILQINKLNYPKMREEPKIPIQAQNKGW